MKISELNQEEKDRMLHEAAQLLQDYFIVKNTPQNVKNLFNRDIAKELSELK